MEEAVESHRVLGSTYVLEERRTSRASQIVAEGSYTDSEIRVQLQVVPAVAGIPHGSRDVNNNKAEKGETIMPQVAVQKIHPNEIESSSLREKVNALSDRIRQRAYELFESRGRGDGSALNDWLQAENDLVLIPKSDLIEKDGQFQLRIAVPGFDPKDIEVNALPDALIVRAQKGHNHESTEGNVYFCEFGEKSLFRRFDLPSRIDVDKVTANLDKGLLTLTASKAEKSASKSAGVA